MKRTLSTLVLVAIIAVIAIVFIGQKNHEKDVIENGVQVVATPTRVESTSTSSSIKKSKSSRMKYFVVYEYTVADKVYTVDGDWSKKNVAKDIVDTKKQAKVYYMEDDPDDSVVVTD